MNGLSNPEYPFPSKMQTLSLPNLSKTKFTCAPHSEKLEHTKGNHDKPKHDRFQTQNLKSL